MGVVTVCVSLLFLVNSIDSVIFPQNANYSIQVPAFYGNRYQEFSAVDGTLVGNLDNSILLNPKDVESFNARLYVSGNQNTINIYNQTTLEFIGTLWTYTTSTTALTYLQTAKLAVVLSSSIISFLNIVSKSQYSTLTCMNGCFDVIQHPMDSNKILVATRSGVEAYYWNAGSYSFDVQYINFTTTNFSNSQSKVTLQYASGFLYVALSNPNRIVQYLHSNNSAVYQAVFFNEPLAGWNLRGFAFYPTATTRIIAVGNAGSVGYIFDYNSTTNVTMLYGQTNTTAGCFVGYPESTYFDAKGNLYITDLNWVNRFDVSTGQYKDTIQHQYGLIYPQGTTYNPLGNSNIAYIATANKILTLDRSTYQVSGIFIPQALPNVNDGASSSWHMVWFENVLYVAGSSSKIVAYNISGQQIGAADTNDGIIAALELGPNELLYASSYFSQNLFQINVTTMNITKVNMTLPDIICPLAFNANKTVMYTCNSGSHGIIAFNTRNWSQITSTAANVSYGAIAGIEIGPDDLLYIASDTGIYVHNGTTLELITKLVSQAYIQNYLNLFQKVDFSIVPAMVPSPSVTPTPSRSPSSSPSLSPSPTPSSSSSASSVPSASVQTTASVSPSVFAISPSPTDNQDSSSNNKKGHSNTSTVMIAVLASVGGALLCTTLAGISIVRRRKHKRNNFNEEPETNALTLTSSGSQSQNLSELDLWHEHWEIDFADIQMKEEIGRGAFGSVFKGEWRNSVCVVKQLHSSRNTKEAIDAFLKEANTVKSLRNHRNVCTIFGVTTNPETPICIVMEYCSGGNLQSALGSQKIPIIVNNLIKIFKDITSGMGHVHLEGIVHCDLACRNMLVSFEGSDDFAVKISDFGLARQIPKGQSISVSDDDIFPIRWSAPELLGTKTLSAACDVWSFGVVMWEIIEGSIPFGSMNNTQVIQHVCNEHGMLPEPSLISSKQLSSEFYDIMKSCWKYDPTERPSFDELHKMFKEMNRNIMEDSKPITVNGQSHYANVSTERNMRYAKISEFRKNANDEHYGNNPTIQ